MSVRVQFLRLDPRAVVPSQQRPGDAGFDLHSIEECTIPPLGRILAKTGVALAIPDGWEGQVRPRSGLALKRGITLLNSPGTIDSGYRGEVGVILFNSTQEAQCLAAGERIAQLVIAPVTTQVEFIESPELPTTERGAGGFGHTGA